MLKIIYLALFTWCIIYGNLAKAEGTVNAEKKCMISITGENYEVGDKVKVYKSKDGKELILAQVEITKKASKSYIGKVINISDNRDCPKLKGAKTAFLESSSGSKIGQNSKVPKLEILGAGNGVMITCAGIAYPYANPCQSAKLYAYNLHGSVDFYPLLAVGNKFVHRLLGLGISASYGGFLQEIPIEANADVIGKLSSTLTSYEVDAIFRVPYASDTISTELRASLLWGNNVTHKFKGEGSMERPVLANLQASSQGIGLTQRFWLGRSRISMGGMYALNSKGTITNPSNTATSVSLNNNTGYKVNTDLDLFFAKLKVHLGATYSIFSGKVTAQTSTSQNVITSSNEQIAFEAGLGVSL